MRCDILIGLAIPALVASAPLQSAQPERLTTATDIIRMHKGGLKDETILEFLRTYKANLVLKGQDMADLAAAGLSDDFIKQLLAYAKSQPQEAKPAPSATPDDGYRPRPNNDTIPPAESSDPDPYYYGPTTRFYVGYPYDDWAFPLWFYSGLYAPFGGYRYYGYPHVYRHFGGYRGPVYRGGFGHPGRR